METKEREIWFPAKRYGWGWGLPICWQGWVAMGGWFVLFVAGAVLLAGHMPFFVLYVVTLQIALVWLCLLKGEKPRWRWGKN